MTLYMINLVCLFLIFQGVFAGDVHLFVNPVQGSDSNTGLKETEALKTIHKAKDKLEETGIKGNAVYIELMAGYHQLESTLVFDKTYTQPITIRAYKNQEVHVIGGKVLNTTLFHGVRDPKILKMIGIHYGGIYQTNLTLEGITDYGKLSAFGNFKDRTAGLELFMKGTEPKLAHWPHHPEFVNIEGVPKGRHGLEMQYLYFHNQHLWVEEHEVWVYGYTYWGWADGAARVKSFDNVTNTITLATDTEYGLRTGHLTLDRKPENQLGYKKQGGYFRLINVLSELDMDHEYHLDRTTGILYLYYGHDPEGVIIASLINNCIEFSHGVSNYNLEDFTLEACRRYGVTADSASNLKLTNMEIRNTGAFGFQCIGDCRHVTIQSSRIHSGDGAIRMEGGDRKTLSSSGNIIEDNFLSNFNRVAVAGASGIVLSGVNTIIRNNKISDSRDACIRWSGNDHVMEYNVLSKCCQELSNCGAIQSGKDWTMRGTVIQHNTILDTVRYYPGEENKGIMLADQFSGVTIKNNVFARNEVHISVEGGRDNVIKENIFYDAMDSSVNVDGRGIYGSVSNESNAAELEKRLQAVPYTDQLWFYKYPKLAAMAKLTEKDRASPQGNQIIKNLYMLRKGKKAVGYQRTELAHDKYFYNQLDNHNAEEKDFIETKSNFFGLRCKAKVWAEKQHFPTPSPFDKTGPRYKYGPIYAHNHGNINVQKPTGNHEPCNGGSVIG